VDRDLQEVFDAQIYLLEELLHHPEGQETLEALIADFVFILDKTLKAIFLSSDNSSSSY
jgi:hypothetical protein